MASAVVSDNFETSTGGIPQLGGASVESRLCKAWVAFQVPGGVVSIKGSYNVASVTDNGVGDFTVNFTTAMTDANYATTVSLSADAQVTWGARAILNHAKPDTSTPPTTSSVRFLAGNGGDFDPDYSNVVIHGN